jgi:hypothetical protein
MKRNESNVFPRVRDYQDYQIFGPIQIPSMDRQNLSSSPGSALSALWTALSVCQQASIAASAIVRRPAGLLSRRTPSPSGDLKAVILHYRFRFCLFDVWFSSRMEPSPTSSSTDVWGVVLALLRDVCGSTACRASIGATFVRLRRNIGWGLSGTSMRLSAHGGLRGRQRRATLVCGKLR